ncbi:MAG: hypothetical protein ACREF4_02320 [Gammaproteobacteria bacterium]
MQSAIVERLELAGVSASAVHPQVVELDAIVESDLVLVDYVLDHWPERDELDVPGVQPRRGAALIAVFRDHLDELHVKAGVPPVAFALRTGRIDKIPSRFPQPITQHAYARANNFEWIFDKEEHETAPRRIAELANAVRRLPDDWEQVGRGLGLAGDLLALPDEIWASDAERDALACHPPLHELSTASDGLAFLRWILHRILPYPCFLYDRHRLSVRLGVPNRKLETAISPDGDLSGLSRLLDPARYSGVLAYFLGPHWWRAGVESILWDATEGEPFSPQVLRRLVEREVGSIDAPTYRFPVLGIQNDYQYLDSPLELESAIRVQPDDWPSFAEDAWTTLELIERYPNLAAIAVENSRSGAEIA